MSASEIRVRREDFTPEIPPVSRKYLEIQCGSLLKYVDNERLWEEKYKDHLFARYELIYPYLPLCCTRMLDVGGGMSGIGALLNRHYRGDISVEVLDGIDDPPVLVYHREPFSNVHALQQFMVANSVHAGKAINARNMPKPDDIYDLVTSFGSWCFHYPPETYLDFVARSTTKLSVVVLEVRNDKPDWMATLCDVFGSAKVIFKKQKWSCCVFRWQHDEDYMRDRGRLVG